MISALRSRIGRRIVRVEGRVTGPSKPNSTQRAGPLARGVPTPHRRAVRSPSCCSSL